MKKKGFNGHTTQTKVGTVRWRIHDDGGRIHNIILPNTYYSSHAESRLLSPQHWAQIAKNGRGTKCTTYHDAIILEWDNRRFKRTIPINSHTRNVGIISTPTGINGYLHKCEEYDKAHQVTAFPATLKHEEDLHVITDDEEETLDQDIQHPETEPIQHEGAIEEERTSPLQIGFNDAQHDVEDEHPTFLDDVQEYMHWHYRLNHALHVVMIKLADNKMLPQRNQILKKMDKQRAKPPMCNDCYCAKASKTPWRGKPSKDDSKKIYRKLKPGDAVSVDQLEILSTRSLRTNDWYTYHSEDIMHQT
jgi:hypothetical protein